MVKNVYEISIKELEEYLKKRKATEKVKKVVTPKKEKQPISQKLSKIISSSGKVINYPKKLLSIAKMRDEELDLSTTPGKLKLTFAELFERRLKSLSGKKTRIRVKIDADVRQSFGVTSNLESKSWGPFEILIPKLSLSDMYKLFIYLLRNNGFSVLSTQTIEEVGAQ